MILLATSNGLSEVSETLHVALDRFSSCKPKCSVSEFFLSQVQGTLLEKRLEHSCFPVDIKKFLRTSILENTSGGCFLSFIQKNISYTLPVTDCSKKFFIKDFFSKFEQTSVS